MWSENVASLFSFIDLCYFLIYLKVFTQPVSPSGHTMPLTLGVCRADRERPIITTAHILFYADDLHQKTSDMVNIVFLLVKYHR